MDPVVFKKVIRDSIQLKSLDTNSLSRGINAMKHASTRLSKALNIEEKPDPPSIITKPISVVRVTDPTKLLVIGKTNTIA